MSHIVEIKTEIRDEQAVRAACTRLQLPAPETKTVRLFSATATGLCVQLPGWSYPVVCNLQSGAVHYDNYNGYWGEQKHLNSFLQAYGVEKAKIEARKKGHAVSATRPGGRSPWRSACCQTMGYREEIFHRSLTEPGA